MRIRDIKKNNSNTVLIFGLFIFLMMISAILSEINRHRYEALIIKFGYVVLIVLTIIYLAKLKK